MTIPDHTFAPLKQPELSSTKNDPRKGKPKGQPESSREIPTPSRDIDCAFVSLKVSSPTSILTINALRPSDSLHVEVLKRCRRVCQNQLSTEAFVFGTS